MVGTGNGTPARMPGEAGFNRIIDARLGAAGPIEYLGMVHRTFPVTRIEQTLSPTVRTSRPCLAYLSH